MIDLKSKSVVVTGAESGIGRAIALRCASLGAKVCAAGYDAAGLRETVALAELSNGGRIIDFQLDIRDTAAIAAMYETTRVEFGQLDAVVANAGVVALSPFEEVQLADWERIISVNLTGTFQTLWHGAKMLIEQGRGGSLIATGSSSAVRVIPNAVAYVASKGGVHAMMEALALDLGKYKIRVNTLVPGQTATPPLRAIPGYLENAASVLPLREVTEPEELGWLVAFAISDLTPHMTGSHLKIDSGRTIA
ncbi:SDR family NAD(P)-dependent oxidoreductase [Pararobbsia alpina]|uniref:Dihydroanticapsin 7-dehydrogenase n=1 Tax=Pararobbsia alpina TaxID=621374 RepID=A0A6S7CH54_9BURK|nr:SDR family oxidoreductase [Pararobbsia alpina]CAB3779962.1 Dihydroanticapsin 7-dehydrogenase [Pararobbsia alpina]